MTGPAASPVGLLGNGGQAAEVADYLRRAGVVVRFRAVSEQYVDSAAGDVIDIARPSAEQRALPVIAAVGSPALRAALVEAWAGDSFAVVRSDLAYVSADAEVAPGAVIAPFAAVGARSAVGRHALLNLGATVNHDCVVGDFATVSPGAHVGGGVVLGDGCFVGIGATVRDYVTLAPGTVVGAGAVVLEDTVENGTYVGVPARRTATREGWLAFI